MKFLSKVLLSLAVIVLFQFSISVYARTEVTDLGALMGEKETKVNDFNEKGQIVGYSNVISFQDDAFIWENGM